MDDYLAKPFEPRELLLRIGSVLRRARAAPVGKPEAEVVRFGPYAFSLERGELRAGEEIVRITDREREILRLLCAKAGSSVSREALSEPGRRGAGADGRRAHQSTSTQDRARSRQSRLSADCARNRLSTGRGRMSLPIVLRDLARVCPRSQPLATWRARSGGSAAEGTLQALAPHRHPADGPAADRRHFCVHAASLGTGHATPFRGGRQRHRRADRPLQEAPAAARTTPFLPISPQSDSGWTPRCFRRVHFLLPCRGRSSTLWTR